MCVFDIQIFRVKALDESACICVYLFVRAFDFEVVRMSAKAVQKEMFVCSFTSSPRIGVTNLKVIHYAQSQWL